MKVFHLSHIDLDGYGAQFVAKHFFEDIVFFNANYGKEILIRLKEMISLIKQESKDKHLLFLVTDLNLSLSEAEFLQEQITELKMQGFELTLMLLDHHISGIESAQKFHWYFLDSTRSACKITFETLIERYTLLDPTQRQWLSDFSNMVNSVDIWKMDGFCFEFGKVAMGMIASLKDPNRVMFEDENRLIKFFMLSQIKDYLHLEDGDVKFDNDLFRLKKLAFNGDPQKQTMDNIFSHYIVHLLENQKDKLSIFYQGHKGILTYTLGNVSVVGNQFLTRNPDFSFFLDVNARGNVSLRANNKLDVSLMASKLFGGGGHKNASGGRIDGFKENFFYTHIKCQIEQILEQGECNE
ncbi:DHH family phosphoesterase [Helicobacter pametensis]|uniref:DHH family phosphoesterase n=1 Tax=Helicobacter pametensis TaxID=95149 RepID=UPI000481BFD7|nr:DHHA1 domain-containing protein [Helicobacter pametensis]